MANQKTPFCQLELVFSDPRISSICERFEIFVFTLPFYDDIDRAHGILTEIASDLAAVLIEQAHEHLDEEDAEEFLELVNDMPTIDRINALLSAYQNNRTASQNGDSASQE